MELNPENHLHVILTGPPGSGKTALLEGLRRRGVQCVDEFARTVINQQRLVGGRGASEQDPALFVELMLKRAMDDHLQHRSASNTVVYDRGLPDLIAYADLFGLDTTQVRFECQLHPYNKAVFFAHAWADIYTQDEERRMTFDAAETFGDAIAQAYEETGYRLTNIPMVAVEDRVEFVMRTLSEEMGLSR